MTCPDCDGPMWDNRETKKNPKQPDFKCKNKACDKAVWLKPKGERSEAAGGSNGVAASRPSGPLAPLYADAIDIANRAVRHHLGTTATAADVIAAAATIFIGATNTGRPIKSGPKPKPAPLPPPPVQEDDNADEYDEAEDLPF